MASGGEEKATETFLSQQNLDRAIDACRDKVDPTQDGELIGVWLLTLIDHWDHDFERLMVVCANSLLIIKYSFVELKVLRTTRLHYYDIYKIQTGEFCYPEKTLVPVGSRRTGHGLRISFNKGKDASALQRYNPWSRSIPFVTLSNHLLARRHAEGMPRHDNAKLEIETFYGRLVEAVRSCHARLLADRQAAKASGSPESLADDHEEDLLQVVTEPVLIETYLGWSAVVHNTSQLGFFKNRGFVNY